MNEPVFEFWMLHLNLELDEKIEFSHSLLYLPKIKNIDKWR